MAHAAPTLRASYNSYHLGMFLHMSHLHLLTTYAITDVDFHKT